MSQQAFDLQSDDRNSITEDDDDFDPMTTLTRTTDKQKNRRFLSRRQSSMFVGTVSSPMSEDMDWQSFVTTKEDSVPDDNSMEEPENSYFAEDDDSDG